MEIDAEFYEDFKLAALEALSAAGALVVPRLVADVIAAGVPAGGDRTFTMGENLLVCEGVSSEAVKALKLVVAESFIVPSECHPLCYGYDGAVMPDLPVGAWDKRHDYKTMHWTPTQLSITPLGEAEFKRLRKVVARRHLSVVDPPACSKQCACIHCGELGPCRRDEGHATTATAGCVYLCPGAFGELFQAAKSDEVDA